MRSTSGDESEKERHFEKWRSPRLPRQRRFALNGLTFPRGLHGKRKMNPAKDAAALAFARSRLMTAIVLLVDNVNNDEGGAKRC